LEAARGGMVLLKNENNILPLQKNKIKTIAIIGPNGQPTVSGGGGSSYVDPLHPLSLVDAIKKIAGDSITVLYEKGIFTGVEFPENLFANFEFYYYKNGKKITGVEAKYYNGKNLEGDVIATKQYEKLHLENKDFWGTGELPEMNFSARYTCLYKPKTSGYYSIGGNGDDGYRIILDGVKIVDMWRDQGPSKSKYDIFLNAGQEYKVEVEYYQSGGGAIIELGAVKVNLDKNPSQYLDLAIQAAKKADLVIMSVGFDNKTEGESFDRTYEMPYFQGSFINQIANVNNNVVVVLNSGGNVEMSSWIQNSKALLMAWYPGQEGNLAAAEILFGKTNPSGKLPASFESTLEENPCFLNYFDSNKDNRVSYNEGIFMGYRYWDKANTKPRFPFGYGLSYTTFAYNGLSTNKTNYSKNEIVEVTVNITNTGNYNGAEVIQLYVSDKECSLPRPIKELKDFDKIMLQKGETKTVKFTLDQTAFSFYNPQTHAWEVESGDFEILVGSSSTDIKQRVSVAIN
jgi:beta-glucosidase